MIKINKGNDEMKIFEMKVDDGSRFGKMVYGATKIDDCFFCREYKVDDNGPETIKWFETYFGKAIPSNPNFSWEYDTTHKTIESRAKLAELANLPVSEKEKAVSDEMNDKFEDNLFCGFVETEKNA